MNDQQSNGPATPATGESKPSGCGTPPTLEDLSGEAKQAGQRIAPHCVAMTRSERLRIVLEFRRQLIPRGRPGRRRKKSITEAHLDWKAGLRPPFLYDKHIPGFRKMSQYRRDYEGRRLMDAIRTRQRRAAKCPT